MCRSLSVTFCFMYDLNITKVSIGDFAKKSRDIYVFVEGIFVRLCNGKEILMTKEWEVWVEGSLYRVVLSDEEETLLAARAAGRVVVGLMHTGEDGRNNDRAGSEAENSRGLYAARYVVRESEADERFLERAVRRELGLPWMIAESERLVVREFAMDDLRNVFPEPGDRKDDTVFYTPELLESYIHDQYGFYECGMWAVVRKADGRLLGKAGVTPGERGLELGYHIFTPYRRRGYAGEACRAVIEYAVREFDEEIWARVKADNAPSRHLLESLGFRQVPDTDSGRDGNGCLWMMEHV